MFAAASTAPNEVCANPRARPALVSDGPAVAETGTFAPATVDQLTASGPAEPAEPDAATPTAGVAGPTAGSGTGSPRCPTATTSPATTTAIPKITAATVPTTVRVRRRAARAMSSLMPWAMAVFDMALQHRADDGCGDGADGQPAQYPRDAGGTVYRRTGAVAPAQN